MTITAHASHRAPNEAEAIHDAAERLAALWMRSYESSDGRVSPSQLRTLLLIDRAPAEAPLTVTRLADELGAMVSSASRLCDRLVAAGLIEREPSPHSRREVQLRLTVDGRRVVDTLRASRVAELRAVLRRMTKPERTALLEGLRAFRRALDGGTPIPRRRHAGEGTPD